MIFSLEKVYWSLTSSLGKMQESYVSPVYQYKCRFLKSEKSAIIPTKNEISNRIQFSVKQNLRTYRMRVKLCYGFNVKDLRDRNYFFGFFHFSAIYLFGKFSSLLTIKIWKFSSPFCSIYGRRNLKKCLYMEIGLYSDMSRSEKNAFIPTKIEPQNSIQYAYI